MLRSERVPLSEEQFASASAARFYDEHARRFMGLAYRRFAMKVAGINTVGNRILDIGTGTGRLAVEIARARPDWQITGIDVSEEMLKLARETAARNDLADRVNFQHASAESLPFPDSYFNLVVSHTSLHLWASPLKVFKEIARVTAPGAYCLFWDNMRLTKFNPVPGFISRIMGMNAAQRRLWIQAMRSSYTAGEAKALLKESPLDGARVATVPGLLMLGVVWRKP